jgi:hypothetical protein
MPGGDGTGPLGRGPMTGRGMGYCVVTLPEGVGEPQGFAGAAGRPVGTGAPATGGLGAIRGMIDSLERQLEDVQARIRRLQRREG